MSLRPPFLDPLFAPLSTLSGVGPKLSPLLDRLLVNSGQHARIIDLLFHIPRGGISRELKTPIVSVPFGIPVTIKGRVYSHKPPSGGKGKVPYRVLLEDETGDVALVFFHSTRTQMEKLLPINSERYVSGVLEQWNGFRQMTHPDRVLDEEECKSLPVVEPVYAQTDGITSRFIGRLMNNALKHLPEIAEWQDEAWIVKKKWPHFTEALKELHIPRSAKEMQEGMLVHHPARKRLAYDELLASQLALALARFRMRNLKGRSMKGDGTLTSFIEKKFPFELTKGQKEALKEIREDLSSEHKMLRLLQGDVGSGKTIVSLLAMASVVESGRQAALMVPTEILARQHFEKISSLLEGSHIKVGILTGREKVSERRSFLEGLQSGSIHIAVGTHALFQENVIYKDLGFAIVDEQHRFGVHQRLALGSKGEGTDVLVMTATPIPRTLAMTLFGDMDISILSEKPAGRKSVTTRLISQDRIGEVVEGLKRAIAAGDLIYWVCPLVAESEVLDLAAAEERFEDLKKYFGDQVGLVHGKMSGEDKDSAMEQFIAGKIKILVSTTVIEVGVDVPEAAIMVVEHAERFGLSQLHQLRGRVGRGERSSTCLLMYKGPLSATAKSRLEIMRETEDGFRIAEEDLKLRGEGEVLGARQSGLPGMKIANLEFDKDLLSVARDDARLIMERDFELTSERGLALRNLLYLFRKDQAIRLLRSG